VTVRVSFKGDFDVANCVDLAELRDKLAENKLQVEVSKLTVPGVKADLVVGLAVASLAVSSVSMVIAVINFWRGQKQSRYRLTLESDGGPVAVDDAAMEVVKQAASTGKNVTLMIEKL